MQQTVIACILHGVQEGIQLQMAATITETVEQEPSMSELPGGLTFMQPELLPWLYAVEGSMKMYLNQDGYKKYGKDIFSVS